MSKGIIFDLGLHDGSDTAYYLYRGYRVIAVDANPVMIEEARAKFADALANGQLTLLNVGISREPGELTFWVSEKTEWSSFDRESASRHGRQVEEITVPCVTLTSLFERFGVPHYLKIDIEGGDSVCLDAITAAHAPRYLSWEWSQSSAALSGTLRRLELLGYDGFKIIRQNDHRASFLPENNWIYRAGRKWHLWFGQKDWTFEYGSSGPFGEETDGRWLSARRALADWERYYSKAAATNFDDWTFWFDFHARRRLP